MPYALPIRPATADDTAAILRLLSESRGECDRAFWSWKHEHSPFGPSPILVAEGDGALVGLRVFSRWRWRSGNREISAVRCVDTATHPAWQGRGIFSSLTLDLVARLTREGVAFAFNTPNAKSMPGYLKMGWRYVTRVPLRARITRLGRLPHLLAVARRRERASSDVPAPPGQFPGVDSLLREPGLPELIERAEPAPELRLHTLRSVDYLRWRYVEIPGYRYSAHWGFEERAQAAIVFRMKVRRGLRELLVTELLLSAGASGIRLGARLLREVCRRADADYVAACAAEGTEEAAALRLAGFAYLPRVGPKFTFRALALPVDLPDPSRWESWRCSVGDLEMF